MKYQINPSATLLVKKHGKKRIVQFLLDGSRLLYKFEVTAIGQRILKKMYDITSDCDITRQFGVTSEDLICFLRPLIEAGLVIEEKHFTDPLHFGERNRRTVEFFSSFFRIENTAQQMTEKMLSSTVLVLGLGGVGTWVVEMLARMGVKSLILVDNDKVELSNIPRQAMFTLNDIGQRKVNVARRYCKSVSKTTKITTVSKYIRSARELAKVLALKSVDIIVNCADKPNVDATNALITRVCFEKRIPHILCGGYDGHHSFLGQTVIPFKTSCWFCYTNSGIYEKILDGFEIIERHAANQIGGTICPMGAQIASLQVQEVVRVLTGCSKLLMINRKAEIDFLNLSHSFTRVPKSKQCKFCKNDYHNKSKLRNS